MKEDKFLEWKTASVEAVTSIEALSSVEVVIALRRESRAYILGDVVLGAVVSVLVTLYLLYSAATFPLHFFAWLPLVMGSIAGTLSSRTRILRRILSSESGRRRVIKQAAQSTFVSLHVGNTRKRTGVLFYFSGLEGELELVCDVGVDREQLEENPAWQDKLRELRYVWRKRGTASKVCGVIEATGPMFAEVVPKRHDDIDELPNEVAL